jgi:lipid II:glycine glycyltransferase (peptidoglycan interpeptide bridge formation enzyme)
MTTALSIQSIDQQTTWEQFVRQFSPTNFLQSWQFGQFNLALGDEPLYLGVYEGERQVGAALFIKTKARRGNYYACAAGPLVRDSENRTQNAEPQRSKRVATCSPAELSHESAYKEVIAALVAYVKKEGDAVCIRIRPALTATDEHRKLFRDMGFRAAPMHLHAERTWVLDLGLSEDELLAGMRKNTRYYVRRAPKDGVVVRMSTDPEDATVMHALQQETVQRQRFVPFSLRFFTELMRAFGEGACLFIARYQDEDIACAMINIYGDMAVYHYAATSLRFPKIPAAYLVLWEAIKEAKRRGCRYFNFWGVVGEDETKHPWHGLSQFKRGFGGYEINYLHAQDYPLSWKYWLMFCFEQLRKRRRGL